MVLKYLLIIFLFVFNSAIAEISSNKAPVQNEKNEQVQKILKKSYSKKFLTLGYFSTQDKVKMKKPDSAYFDLLSSRYGMTWGYLGTRDVRILRLETAISIFLGNTDAKSNSDLGYYFSAKMPTYGVQLGLAPLVMLGSEKRYFLGPELNFSYLYTKWFIPTNALGSWAIEKNASMKIALLISGEYHYGDFFLFHKFGYAVGATSSIWNIGLGYNL